MTLITESREINEDIPSVNIIQYVFFGSIIRPTKSSASTASALYEGSSPVNLLYVAFVFVLTCSHETTSLFDEFPLMCRYTRGTKQFLT
jgi:hypothetical protein